MSLKKTNEIFLDNVRCVIILAIVSYNKRWSESV